MLKCMEGQNSNPDVDRVCDLIKVSDLFVFLRILSDLKCVAQGNMQRNKIVADGIDDAKAQILRVFEHKAPVADIINRCASKRNFKKREKS